jgi:dUTPase
MVVSAYYDVTYEESDKLEPSQRGKGGFGSTG